MIFQHQLMMMILIINHSEQADQLTQYLEMHLDKSRLSHKSLELSKKNRILARVIRKIHCISVVSVAVERRFSEAKFCFK